MTEEKGFVINEKDSQNESLEDNKQGLNNQETVNQLPKIDFATFIFSLNSSVLFHLGEIADPNSGKKTKNLLLAKQTVDIISMLEEKTRGNLTKDEEELIRNILYELRILYVKGKNS